MRWNGNDDSPLARYFDLTGDISDPDVSRNSSRRRGVLLVDITNCDAYACVLAKLSTVFCDLKLVDKVLRVSFWLQLQ